MNCYTLVRLVSPLLLTVASTPAPAPAPTPTLTSLLPVSVFSAAALVRRPTAPLLAIPAVSLVCGVGVSPRALVFMARFAIFRVVTAVRADPMSLLYRGFGSTLVSPFLSDVLLRPPHLPLFFHTALSDRICLSIERCL